MQALTIANPRAALAAMLVVFGLASAVRLVEAPDPTLVKPREPPAPQAARLREGSTIDLNAANETDLALLPRIGPALARRIVEHRRSHGRFVAIDELGAVRGCGPKTLDAVRPYLTVGPSAATSVAPSSPSR